MKKDFQFSTHPPPLRTDFDIPIFQKTYDFYKEFHLSLINFPKQEKYTLGQTINNTSLDLFELLFLASRNQQEKVTQLERADSKLEILKVLIRLAKDTKSLDNNKYINLENHLQEIGKMLGGWLKHAKQIT